MKKILFIHIPDPSTDFLAPIYMDYPNKTVIRDNLPPDEMNRLIREHDQVVMMGHGSSSGLFGTKAAFIIGAPHVEALSEKDNNIFIWCFASSFVNHYKLKGFSTSMFISEDGEAVWALPSGTYRPGQDEESITQSNELFVEAVRKNIDLDTELLAMKVIEEYAPSGITAENKNALIFNRRGLCLHD